MAKEDIAQIEQDLLNTLLYDPDGERKFKQKYINIIKAFDRMLFNSFGDDIFIRTEEEYEAIAEDAMQYLLQIKANSSTNH